MDKNIKSRDWQFTINNYTKKDLKKLYKIFQDKNSFDYVVLGFEKGEKKGTEHIQGFIRLNQSQRFSFLPNFFKLYRLGSEKNKFLNFHREIARDSQRLIKYSKKDGNWIEFGNVKIQGERSDLNFIKERLSSDPADLKNLVVEQINNFQQLKFAEGLQKYYFKKRFSAKFQKVIWIYGGSALGKSSYIYDNFDDSDIFSFSNKNYMGDNYHQEKVFLIDDFRRDDINFNTLLKLFDRFPFTLNTKGGFVPFNSEFIFVTAPKKISDMYGENGGDDIKQLVRRVYEIDVSDLVDFDIHTFDFEKFFTDHNLKIVQKATPVAVDKVEQDDFEF